MNCIHCSVSLTRKVSPGSAVEIDYCPEHGTWFDGQELEQVIQSYPDRPMAAKPSHRATSSGAEEEEELPASGSAHLGLFAALLFPFLAPVAYAVGGPFPVVMQWLAAFLLCARGYSECRAAMGRIKGENAALGGLLLLLVSLMAMAMLAC